LRWGVLEMADRQFARQLATIVSIDAVGFSRLMGIDEEATLTAFEERRTTIRETCAQIGGRIFGAAGDSLMAEFGNPGDALRAALEFQQRLGELDAQLAPDRRMPFRAGINTGTVILRDELRYGDDVNIAARLQELAPEGGVVISETTWHHVRSHSAAEFRDLGEQQFKNILFPVKAFLALRPRDGARPSLPEPAAMPRRSRGSAGGPPAIAVLPFRTPREHDLDYIADGIAEDIIMGLSGTRWLPVIARSSSFQFRDDDIGTVAAGHALGARYVVSGSLSRIGDQIRLKTVLEDVSGGRMIWSRRFDRAMADLPGMQDEVGAEIVGMLEKEVDRVEQARSYQIPWESLETWQLVRRGRMHMQRRTREDTELGFDFYMKAFARDPNSSAVLNELAWWHFWRAWVTFGQGDGYREDLDRVITYSRRALFVDSQDARPHAHLGVTDIMLTQPVSAIEHLTEAIRINPSFAFARSAMGSAHILMRRPGQALPYLLEADRLSPFDLYRFHNLGEIAVAHSLLGEWQQAVDAADRSLMLSPGYWYARFLKIGALARLGRLDEARAEVANMRHRYPDFSHSRAEYIPFAEKEANAFLIEGYLMAEASPGSL
jgi:adenylate cyclase